MRMNVKKIMEDVQKTQSVRITLVVFGAFATKKVTIRKALTNHAKVRKLKTKILL